MSRFDRSTLTTPPSTRTVVRAVVAAAIVQIAGGAWWVAGGDVAAAPTVVGSITGAGAGAGTRSGVFRDVDSDGTWDAGEPGQGDIDVTATCIADTGTDPSGFDDVTADPVSTTTAADGSFTLAGADVRGLCRVEFSIPADLANVLQPGVATAAVSAPDSAGSFVQFVDASADPTVTAAVHNPGSFTGSSSTPDVATGRSLPGASAAGSNDVSAGFDTVLRLDYGLGAPTALAQGDDTGSIWGIAWEPATETIFAAAVLKRHSGMGPDGPDAIYALGANVPAAWATPFTAVDTDGGAVLSDAARGLGNASAPSDDDLAFEQVGTLGWGDIDISEDGRTLYAVNLMTRTVQEIDVDTKTAGAAHTIPDPGCTSGTARPWGLEVDDGLVYTGVVCDGAAGSVADVAAFVYAYNPTAATLPLAGSSDLAAGTWSANLVDDADAAAGIQLGHPKGCALTPNLGCGWNPWDDTYSDAEFKSGPSWAAFKPQPILSDLEVDDDGSLILAFADRATFQLGYRNVRPNSADQTTNLEGIAGGDVLRAARPSGVGAFTLESGGTVAVGAPLGGGSYTGAANNQGPGGGEVYSREGFSNLHEESALGSIAKVPGRSDYLMGIMDPIDTDSGGIGSFPVNGAARLDAVELYDSTLAGGEGSGYGFGKGAGLADIEVLTELAPVEVGNRVWRDDDADGVQDAGEPPIEGVIVELTVGATTYSATTDATGTYLFSSVARSGATTAPLLAGANFRFDAGNDAAEISIPDTTGGSQQAPLAGLLPTAANEGAANSDDSDGVETGTAATVTFTLGSSGSTNDANALAGDVVEREGHNRHVYDFGFVPIVSVGNRVWFDTDNDSVLDVGEQAVGGVVVELFHDADSNGLIEGAEQTAVATDTTDAAGLYFFDQRTDADGDPLPTPELLVPGSYVVGIPASNLATSAVLEGYHSSATTINAAGVMSETGAADPDDDVNADDNGTLQTSGFYAGGVLSAPVALSYDNEPAAEEAGAYDNNDGDVPDTSSNLTVDFGFARVSVGNTVWVDDGRGGGTADDGVQNGSEPGLAGVAVRLLSGDGSDEIPVGFDGVLGTADDGDGGIVTGVGGSYGFTGLPAGPYRVEITVPAGYRSSTDPATGATSFAADLDDNGTGAGTGSVSTTSFTIVAGAATDGHVATASTGSTTNPRVDFGLVPLVSLGDLVWVDRDGDGVLDTGETVLAGVTVELLDEAGDPAVDAGGDPVDPVATDGNGRYSFTNLVPGRYRVRFSLPDGYVWTIEGGGADDSLDSDAIASSPTAATATTAIVDLTATAVADSDPRPTRRSVTDPTVDAGVRSVASIGDVVWIDADRDGQFDPAERPLPGVTVALVDAEGDPVVDAAGDTVEPTTTDADGRYSFELLEPGDYRVVFTRPDGYAWTDDDRGDDGLDSDAIASAPRAATASTAVVSLTTTVVSDSDARPSARPVTNPTIDAGLVPLVAVGDYVWRDRDVDGRQDDDEPPVAGVSVTLLDPDGNRAYDADGDPVPTTVTDVDGFYVFDNLLPGDYRVSFRNLPDGFTFTTTGSGGASDSNPPASGLTPVFTISPTDRDTRAVTSADPVTVASLINPTIDAGIIDPTVDGLIPVPGTATTTTVAPTTTAVGGDSNLPAAGADSLRVGFAALLVSIAGVGLVLASRRRPAAR